ncbi:MAG: hypothetical protein ACFWTJ_02600 [Lachnoclostridium sp.]
MKDFNPRTHVGCDLPVQRLINAQSDFNPRTHVGCDSYIMYDLCKLQQNIDFLTCFYNNFLTKTGKISVFSVRKSRGFYVSLGFALPNRNPFLL